VGGAFGTLGRRTDRLDLITNVRMFAISSSLSWLIGGITEL
jgi:hypothetical protein